ncbi:uncharacterized protein EI97DRAFT_455669 [Westerdykella ornata]|uniref:Uncharacterized protein n=1 Tax=Westerdykella ornata TaxID=318751 RepID=A0A6A6JT35_WESOR|nr:uncharacterized protein EI97DRAFT_455669 [Westerdykella ornata]KAF2279425.1 hypothetical protein EI97DRAFT_455669 [Westerdykella ornata]
MHHHVSSYYSRRDGDPAVKGAITPTQQKTLLIVLVVLTVFIILAIGVPILYFKLLHRSRTQAADVEKACNACTNTDNSSVDPNLPFLQRHLAVLRAWKKPTPITNGSAPKMPLGISELWPTVPKPVAANKRYSGRPMDFYTQHRRFHRVSGGRPVGGVGAPNGNGGRRGNASEPQRPPPVPPKDGPRRYNPYYGGLAMSPEYTSPANPFHGKQGRYR